jgi:methylthioribose-1-phosphate isomerase
MPIEERDPREVTEVQGRLANGGVGAVRIAPPGVTARNFAFDVTPARLVSGLVTERGVCAASEAGLRSLYPEQKGEAE